MRCSGQNTAPCKLCAGRPSLGVAETISNIANLTVVSKDANDLKAEYRAGFVQGKLQGKTIIAARDNAWDHKMLQNSICNFEDLNNDRF